MVANTLGIKERTLINWIIKKNEESKESVPVVARSGLSEPVGEEDRNSLIHWLNTIPTVPSHCCRKQKSYEGVKFLFPGKSMRELHRDYLESCRDSQTRRRAVGWKLINEAFHAQKLSVFIPRKDQCDVCISAKLEHITNEMHERHTERKPAAQQEKEKDKTESDTQTSVWTMNL
ncbi:DNA repair protein rhp54 [Elysia marginata]|uniref:DNA repair protein rhp54 n=1 Tax=Elysia marginata TaxID=1093978 RepID=A0AAV4GE02_9GAST|nr:DNA repair protein rhp54 [Elysia marginata]